MWGKPYREITISDVLEKVIVPRRPEDRALEYKAALTKEPDDFNWELCALANTQGGFLILGVKESAGLAESLNFIPYEDLDKTRLQIENSAIANIVPRLRMDIVEVKGDSGYILVIRVPKSVVGPHTLRAEDKRFFYARNSGGKFRMDVNQLREAFLSSSSQTERILAWRDRRFDLLHGGESPIVLSNEHFLAIHIVPASHFGDNSALDVVANERRLARAMASLIDSGGYNDRLNMDGLCVYPGESTLSNNSWYAQAFRDGCMEAVWTHPVFGNDDRKFLRTHMIEELSIRFTSSCVSTLVELGLEYPFLALHRLFGVHNAGIRQEFNYADEFLPIERNTLDLPNIMIDETVENIDTALKPAFDAMWNACGISKSRNFNEQGRWKPKS